MPDQTSRKPYPSDLSDAQWEVLAPLIPEPSPEATRPTLARREIESAHSLHLANWQCVAADAP
jgi:transposase